MYALLTAPQGGFPSARDQRTVEPLPTASHTVSAYIAAMPVTRRREALRTDTITRPP